MYFPHQLINGASQIPFNESAGRFPRVIQLLSMTATAQFVIRKQLLKVVILILSPHDVPCECVALEENKWQNKMPNVCKLTKECQTVPNLCEFLLSV